MIRCRPQGGVCAIQRQQSPCRFVRVLLTTSVVACMSLSAVYGQTVKSRGTLQHRQDPPPERLAQAATHFDFRIPAQPLADALAAFSVQTGMHILYEGALASGVQSPGVVGTYTAEQALQRLLAGTGLTSRTTANTVSLQRQVTTAPTTENAEQVQRLAPMTVQETVTARRTSTPIANIPEAVTVVTRDEIEREARISRSLQKLLVKKVPGLVIETEDECDIANIRGRPALILINGVPQDQQLRSAEDAINVIDINAIERIEVVRGASAIYGFGAPGGIINIITKTSDTIQPTFTTRVGTRFSATHPEDSFVKEVYQDVSGAVGNIDYRVGFAFEDRDSAFDAEGDRLPIGSFNRRDYNLDGSLGWRVTPQQSVRLTGNYFRSTDGPIFSNFEEAGIFGEQKTPAVRIAPDLEDSFKQVINISLFYDHQNVVGSALNVQVFYQDFERENFGGFRTEDGRIGARLNIATPLKKVWDGAKITWGSDLLRYRTFEKVVTDTFFGEALTSPNWIFTPETVQYSYAFFGQLEVPIGKFLLTGGVRFERFHVDIADTNARLEFFPATFEGGTITYDATLFNAGIVYFLTDAIELFGSFTQGLDVTQVGRATVLTDRADAIDPDPATTDHFAIGMRAAFRKIQGSVSAFYSNSDLASTLISINPNFPLVPLRQPERIWGVEATIDVQPVERWAFGGTFTWQDGERELDDGSIESISSERISPLRVTAYAEYTPLPWWLNRLQFLYAGENRFDLISDYYVVDYYAHFTTPYGRFTLAVENLLNELYFPAERAQARQSDFDYIPAQGTTISLTYTLNWNLPGTRRQ